MRNYIKGALVFTGGVTTGVIVSGVVIAHFLSNHKTMTRAIGRAIGEIIIYGDEPCGTYYEKGEKYDGKIPPTEFTQI